MKAVIVGFGGMGCRHAYSLLIGELFDEIWIVEPTENIFDENTFKIGIDKSSFKYVKSLDHLPGNIDFAVVATTSVNRYDVFEYLVTKKLIKFFLLEKVLFQCRDQFTKALELIHKYEVKAYCNFVNRYYPNYVGLRKRLSTNSNLKMIISGGEFGLACNSLHYIDLFQYLSNGTPNLSSYNLIENPNPHKRGSGFKEVFGQMLWRNEMGGMCIINSDLEKCPEVEISIFIDNDMDILNEKTLTHVFSVDSQEMQSHKFEILFSSDLTNEICKDILRSKCFLPQISETMHIHIELFKAINKTLKLSNNQITPIT